jgi:hypothetical protein
MKHLFLSILLVITVSLQGDYTPNFTIKTEEYHLPSEAPFKSYQFRCIGTEKNIDVTYTWMRMDQVKASVKARINEDGLLTLRGEDGKVIVTCFGTVPGESMTVEVVSREFYTDTKEPVYYAKHTFIPRELVVKSGLGASMECMMLDSLGEAFVITLKGIAPNETVDFESVSSNEVMRFDGVSDSKGEIMFSYFPAVIGKASGPFRLTATHHQFGVMVLSHAWGLSAIKKL